MIGKKSSKHSAKEYLLDLHEAADFLEVSESELRHLVEEHKLHSKHLRGDALGFEKKEIEELKNKWRIERELFPERARHLSHHTTFEKPRFWENLADFWYFNDFYIICSAAIAMLVYFILSFNG